MKHFRGLSRTRRAVILGGMNQPAAHLLVVDDDKRLRSLLQQYLSERGYAITTAVDASDARAKMALFAFDLAVLDVMMPGETGLSLLQGLRKSSDLPVLMLTARDEPADRIAGLEAGADDYLPKPFEPKELLLRIEAILRRRPQAEAPGLVRMGRWQFDPSRDELRDGQQLIPLSAVEAGLLRTLSEAANSPISRDDLAGLSPMVGNARTIDVQVTRLRRKIEQDPRQPRYLITVRGEGYMLRPDP